MPLNVPGRDGEIQSYGIILIRELFIQRNGNVGWADLRDIANEDGRIKALDLGELTRENVQKMIEDKKCGNLREKPVRKKSASRIDQKKLEITWPGFLRRFARSRGFFCVEPRGNCGGKISALMVTRVETITFVREDITCKLPRPKSWLTWKTTSWSQSQKSVNGDQTPAKVVRRQVVFG